jgi:hypothetical protein
MSEFEVVNVGNLPNDGEGDPLRVAFTKINNNFFYMQQTAYTIASAVTLDNAADQVIWEYPANQFTQAIFQIQSSRDGSIDSQNIQISAQIYNDESDVKFTAFATTFVGNALTTYDMIVDSGNVKLLVSPLIDDTIEHFISYQITYRGDLGLGVPMLSENGQNLITETGSNVCITTEN